MSEQSNSPTFTSIHPHSIGLGGGKFKITGTNLKDANEVDFKKNGVSVIGVTDITVTGTTITGPLPELPDSVSGAKLDVTVYISGIPKNTSLTMSVKGPSLSNIIPQQGIISGGTGVTLTGEYLTKTSEVLFAGIQATSFEVVNDTTIKAVTPKGLKAGKVNVTVSVQGVTSNAVQFTYTLKSDIPLTIDTSDAGLPTGTPVYMYIVGEVKLSDSEKHFYRLGANGTPKRMSTSDNSVPKNIFPDSSTLSHAAAKVLQDNYLSNWADYSIPVATNGKTTINLAEIKERNIRGLGTGSKAFSGRIYLSVGVPRLPITVNSDGYVAPVFFDGSGQYTLFDWIEFSFDSLQNFNANTTMVDQFGLSLTLSSTPNNPKPGQITKVGLNTGFTRNDMVEVQAALYSEGRVIAPKVTTEKPPAGKKSAYPSSINFNVGGILRVCSPNTIDSRASINAGLSDYFGATISKWYKTWKTTPLVVTDSQTGSYSAVADSNGALKFKEGNLATLEQWNKVKSIAFSFSDKITTANIWQCDGMLATGGTASKNAGKIIAAAFNRGVMSNNLTDVNCKDCSGDFYPNGGVWSQWSKLAHQYSLQGLAYGFAYDDVCDQNPTIALSQPESIEISLEAF